MRAYEEVVGANPGGVQDGAPGEDPRPREVSREVVVGRELKMIALEKELEALRAARRRSCGPPAM